MSSTNRGGFRHASDYYATPTQEIKRFLPAMMSHYNISNPEDLIWYDPCAGGGIQIVETRSGEKLSRNNPMAYPSTIQNLYGAKVITQDIREDSEADHIGSYIDMENKYNGKGIQTEWFQNRLQTPIENPDVIITNPPFSHATQVIKQALLDVSPDGYVVMLLRLNFFGSQEREEFFKDNIPDSIFVHSRRMSFTPDRKTDSVEYAHFVWKPNNQSKFSALYHLSPITHPINE